MSDNQNQPDSVKEWLRHLDTKIDGWDDKFNRLEVRWDEKLGAVEKRFDKVDEHFDCLVDKIVEIKDDISEIKLQIQRVEGCASNNELKLADHEGRIRKVEKFEWQSSGGMIMLVQMISTAAALIGIAYLVFK